MNTRTYATMLLTEHLYIHHDILFLNYEKKKVNYILFENKNGILKCYIYYIVKEKYNT